MLTFWWNVADGGGAGGGMDFIHYLSVTKLGLSLKTIPRYCPFNAVLEFASKWCDAAILDKSADFQGGCLLQPYFVSSGQIFLVGLAEESWGTWQQCKRRELGREPSIFEGGRPPTNDLHFTGRRVECSPAKPCGHFVSFSDPWLLDFLLNFLRILKTSGQCYGGRLFSMILFIFFMKCSNRGLDALVMHGNPFQH